jgi:hypothetical protein
MKKFDLEKFSIKLSGPLCIGLAIYILYTNMGKLNSTTILTAIGFLLIGLLGIALTLIEKKNKS